MASMRSLLGKYGLKHLFLDWCAYIAGATVHTDETAARRTSPLLSLLNQKRIQPLCFHGFLNLSDVRRIFCSVAFVERFKPRTRIAVTDVTEVSFSALAFVTVSDDAAQTGVRQILAAAAAAASVLLAHVRVTYRAVEPARRDHTRVKSVICLLCHQATPLCVSCIIPQTKPEINAIYSAKVCYNNVMKRYMMVISLPSRKDGQRSRRICYPLHG